MTSAIDARIRTSLALAAGLLLSLAIPSRAAAQSVPVFLVGARTDDVASGTGAVNRVAAAIGASSRSGSALAQELAERYASLPLRGDPLEGARDRIRNARRAWSDAAAAGNEAASALALDALDTAAHELESMPGALDTNPENAASLQTALVFLAERWDTAGFGTRAADAMRRLARVDPTIAFTARAASPAVQHHYAEAVASLPRGALSVESSPPGCTVVRDGRNVGAAPVELQDLPQGWHRLQVECGATVSLVHPVDVAARTRSTLVIDVQLDAALALDTPTPALRYPSVAAGRARLAGDLARLGRALGAARAYAVFPGDDRVVVVDVASATEVGESPVTDGSRLRALLSQPVSATTMHASVDATGHATDTAPRTTSTSTQVSSRGSPVAGIVLGVVGLGGIGAGIYGAMATASAENTAQQAQDASRRHEAEDRATIGRVIEIAGFAGGGVLLVTGVLVGVLAGSSTHTEQTVTHASITPLPEGGAYASVTVRF